MNEPPIALIIVIAVVFFVACTAVTLYLMRDQFGALFGMIRSKVVAQADAGPTAPFAFSLRYVCQQPKPHRVCLRLRLRSQSGSSGSYGPTADVGLTCAYQVTLGGTVVAKEVVGYGSNPPKPFDRHITRTFFSSESHWGSGYTKKGTIVLRQIDRCPQGEEIVVEGSCELDPGTEPESLSVSLRA